MILSGQSIRDRALVHPCCERSKACGMTYGLGPAGYDIRIDMPEDAFGELERVER